MNSQIKHDLNNRLNAIDKIEALREKLVEELEYELQACFEDWLSSKTDEEKNALKGVNIYVQ